MKISCRAVQSCIAVASNFATWTKCPHRENQGFQLTSLGNALGLTGRSVSKFTHRLRQLRQDSGQRFSPRFFTTHNLLVKNETKKSQPAGLGEKENDLVIPCEIEILGAFIPKHRSKDAQIEPSEMRQVWGSFWSEARNIWRGSGEIRKRHLQDLSKFTPKVIQVLSSRNYAQKSASPAGVPRGCDRRKNLVRKCVTPPWNDLKRSEISFINPLRFAPIANATTGLIQAQIFHSYESPLRGDSV